MYCAKCGEALVSGENYCVYCGAAKHGKERRAAVVPGIVFCVVLALMCLLSIAVVHDTLNDKLSVYEGCEIKLFGWQFYPPKGWEMFSEEELQAQLGAKEQSFFRYECAAYQTDGLGEMTVSVMGVDGSQYSNCELAALLFASDEAGNLLKIKEKTKDGNYVAAVNETVTIAGEEYGYVTLLTTHAEVGEKMYITYYVRVVDDIACIIEHAYPVQEPQQAELIRNAFERLEG